MPSFPEATTSVAVRKQALQDQVLATIQSRRLAGIALTMGLGKTLIGLRNMDRLLAAGQLADQATGKPFLVAAPTQAILDSWPQKAHKFGLAHLLDQITFTTYRSLAKTLAAGTFHKLYLDECHALKDSHEPGLKAHAAKKRSILGLTGTPPAQAHSEKGRLVATYCHRGGLHHRRSGAGRPTQRLPPGRAPSAAAHPARLRAHHQVRQPTTSERENYHYWSKRLANAAQDPLPVETLHILRMQALMNYPGKGHYMRYLAGQQTEKVLLFTSNQQQAEEQAEHTYHSKNKESQQNLAKFNAGDILRLACVAQLSEGISIPNLRVGIIWHAFGNERKAAQRIGRLLRLNPDQTATVHLLAYQDTVDEQWVTQALDAFDPAKISYVDAPNYVQFV